LGQSAGLAQTWAGGVFSRDQGSAIFSQSKQLASQASYLFVSLNFM
jgi:hypothetical protein